VPQFANEHVLHPGVLNDIRAKVSRRQAFSLGVLVIVVFFFLFVVVVVVVVVAAPEYNSASLCPRALAESGMYFFN